jgi:hypothetical protein
MPDDIGRLWRIIRGLLTAAAALMVLFIPIAVTLDISGYLTPRFELLLQAAMAVVARSVLYVTMIRRIAAPGLAGWRVIDIDDGSASRFSLFASLAAVVAVVNAQVSTLADELWPSTDRVTDLFA